MAEVVKALVPKTSLPKGIQGSNPALPPNSMPFKNRERNRQWWIEKRRAVRAIVEAAKSRPCADCHIQYAPWIMEFDHVRGKKEFTIANTTRIMLNVDLLIREIAKCDVVCANCHAERTHARALVSGKLAKAETDSLNLKFW